MCDGIEESMGSYGEGLRRSLGSLRGVKWRMDLGILPTSPSASVNDLRRLTADSRRRYFVRVQKYSCASIIHFFFFDI
ncbi:hypothetical protein LIER_44138 [Lithospermum erythrorhizon]|uniref:Uncharacterized protein n=1 Tax=Lithospermum erythrorhizon TaxID=34254 RepID=A0AAV3QBB9_LITER